MGLVKTAVGRTSWSNPLRVVGTLAALVTITVTGVTVLPSVAGASSCVSLGGAGGYNVYTTGTASESSSYVAGAAAYGGVATISAANYGGSLTVPSVALVLGASGSSVQYSSLSSGSNGADYVGTLTSTANLGTFTQVAASSLPINFGTAASMLTSASSTLNGLTATDTATGTTALSLTSSGTGTDVFSITSAQLAAATSSITVNAPSGAVVVVNVSGTSFSATSLTVTLAGGVTAPNVIWNFPSVTSSTFQSVHWNGTIVQPSGSVTLKNSYVTGSVLAGGTGTFSANNLSQSLFTGCAASGPPAGAPEAPAAVGLPALAIGVVGGAYLLMRRRRAQRVPA